MRRLLISSFLAATALLTSPAFSEDEFGCKVLLCAASENPSWRGVPYCVPVMAKLYSMMKSWSFAWPVCTSAGTGAPGYEQYDDCPEGWTASVIGSESNRDVFLTSGDGGQHVCQKETQTFFGCNGDMGFSNTVTGHGGRNCVQTIPRPLRAEPYYFDIPDHKRVYFNVR